MTATAPQSVNPASLVTSRVGGGVSGLSGPVGPDPGHVPAVRIVSRFQPGHGWVQSGSNGTISDDVGVFMLGGQSLNLTTTAAQNYTFARRTGISPAIDLTAYDLRLWVRVADVSRLSQLLIYVSSTGFGSSSNANFNVLAAGNYPIIRSGEWACVTFGRNEFVKGTQGAGPATDYAAINALQVGIVNKTGGAAASVNIQAVDVVQRPARGYVSFTFDDGFENVFTKAKPVMDKYGYAGTCFVIADIIGNAGYMSHAQLRALERQGWEVAAHSMTLADHNLSQGLKSLSTSALRANLLAQRQWLWANGYRGTGIAYPRGAFDTDMLAEVRKVYRYGRTVTRPGGMETVPPPDPYLLRPYEVFTSTTTSQVAAAVDASANDRRWTILEFHQVVDATSVGAQLETTVVDFTAMVDDVAARGGVVVLPVGDVLSRAQGGGA